MRRLVHPSLTGQQAFPAGRKSPIRVLFVVHSILPSTSGGTEVLAWSMAEELAARGHVVRFFHPKLERAFEDEVRRFKPDIVHVHHIRDIGTGIFAVCQRRSVPYVVSLHDFWPFCALMHLYPGAGRTTCSDSKRGRRCPSCFLAAHYQALTPDTEFITRASRDVREYRGVMRAALSRAVCLIAPSDFVKRRFLREWPALKNKIVVSPHGIRPFSDARRIRRRHAPVIGFLGGLADIKGLAILVSALESIRGRLPLVRLYGATRSAFSRWIRDAGLSPKVRGAIDVRGIYNRAQMPSVFSGLDAVVVPSLMETFSLVASEAIHAGCAVIASDAGGLSEIVRQSPGGILFKPGDVRMLSRLIERHVKHTARTNVPARSRTSRTSREACDDIVRIYLRGIQRASTRSVPRAFRACDPALLKIRRVLEDADRLTAAGNRRDAIAILNECVRRHPDQIIARYRLAGLHRNAGNHNEAAVHYRAALSAIARLPDRFASTPYEAGACFHLARYYAAENHPAVSPMLARCIKLIPWHIQARKLLAQQSSGDTATPAPGSTGTW